MASLYAAGWRQGSLLTASLPFDSVVLDAGGRPVRAQDEHNRWVIATQDCDLDQTETEDPTGTIELRPVFAHDPPSDWGLRSARYRLNDREYVHGMSPRTMASAAVLSAIDADGGRDGDPPPARQRGFKTWLGLRYDRPAVPDGLVSLARRIAEEVDRKKNRPIGMHVRDVLMQFDDDQEPVRFSLFAVLERAEDRDSARAWLAQIAIAVPDALGIADELEAREADGISLHLVETSYAADVSQLTWRPNNPEPTGAE